MQLEIKKRGRGAGVKLPDEFLKELGWKQGDTVQLTVRDGRCFVEAVGPTPDK